MKPLLNAILIGTLGATMASAGVPDPGSHRRAAVERPASSGRHPPGAGRGAAEPDGGNTLVETGAMMLASMGLIALGAAVGRRRR